MVAGQVMRGLREGQVDDQNDKEAGLLQEAPMGHQGWIDRPGAGSAGLKTPAWP